MRHAAGFLLFSAETGRVLLLLGAKGLEFPGGMREPGESSDQSALRELSEETGYVGPVEFGASWIVMRFPNGDYVSGEATDSGSIRYRVFIGVVGDEFDPTLSHEHDDWGWFALQELNDERLHQLMHPGASAAIASYLI